MAISNEMRLAVRRQILSLENRSQDLMRLIAVTPAGGDCDQLTMANVYVMLAIDSLEQTLPKCNPSTIF